MITYFKKKHKLESIPIFHNLSLYTIIIQSRHIHYLQLIDRNLLHLPKLTARSSLLKTYHNYVLIGEICPPIGRKHREREKCVFLTNIFFSLPSRPSLARSNRPTLKVRASLAMQPLLLVYEAPKLKTDLISPRKTEQNKTRTEHTQDFGTRHHSPILFLAVFSLSSDW